MIPTRNELIDGLRGAATLVILAGLALIPACTCQGFDRCEEDQFGCDAGTDAFVLDSSCTLTGELTVKLGYGQSAYVGLAAGELPKLVGGPQGGTHSFLGVRVENASLDVYDKLKVLISTYGLEKSPCTYPHGDPWPAKEVDTDPEPAYCRYPNRSRELLFGQHHPIVVASDGAVEEYGIFLRLDEPLPGWGALIEVDVTDPCSRTGHLEHIVTVSPPKTGAGP